MPRASWKGVTVAEAAASDVVTVEGNLYFPLESVRTEHLLPSDTHTICSWKGTASYYHVAVNGEVNRDAAWYYPAPYPAAEEIRGRVAFWRGVHIEP